MTIPSEFERQQNFKIKDMVEALYLAGKYWEASEMFRSIYPQHQHEYFEGLMTQRCSAWLSHYIWPLNDIEALERVEGYQAAAAQRSLYAAYGPKDGSVKALPSKPSPANEFVAVTPEETGYPF